MNTLKNILFYIEPWIELTEDFRLGAYSHFNYFYENLKKVNPSLHIKFLVSDSLHSEIQRKKSEWLNDDLCIVKLEDLEAIYPDYKIAAQKNYLSLNTKKDKSNLAGLIKASLGSWRPDLIIMHETQAPFLQYAFPQALILHSMYGMTFREPYPQTYLFDHRGLYANSIFNAEDVLSTITLSENDKDILHKIKNWYAQQIIPHDPTWGIVEKYQSQYDKIILLPLQVDDYYAFTECCGYSNQLDFLQDVLEQTPKEWGVIVTGHSEYIRTVSENRFLKLKLKYENLIQLDELDNIPYVSQALLPHVDAVVSVSSSLGFQTLIYNKPLIVAGSSHINKVATCELSDILNVFTIKYDEEKNFKILKFFFLKYHLLHKMKVENFSFFNRYLAQYYENFLNNKESVFLPDLYETLEEYYHDLIKVSQWREWSNKLKSKNIPIKQNPIFVEIIFNEVISWDLFDTLVDRPFIHPHELFQAIEDKAKHLTNNVYLPFHMLRRESERLARYQFANNRREVKYDEIYTCFEQMTSLNKKYVDILKKIELEAESFAIKPRRLMKRTWDFAGVFGKVRSIITDIYLDESFIQQIVTQNGYCNYDVLLVSSEERVRKEDGSIFPEYINLINQKAVGKTKLIHIGDNPRADGEMPRKYGIKAIVIPKAIDQLKQSYYAKLLEKPLRQNSYDTSLVIGLIANRLFSSPRTSFDKDTIGNHELYNLGYSVVGPFLVGYVQWVIRKIKNHDAKKVYFLARDGYLIQKVYEIFKQVYKDLPEERYLLCSRRGLAVPGIFDLDNIFETAMLNYGHTTIGDFLSSRFGLMVSDIPKHILKKYNFKTNGSSKIRFPDDISITNNFVKDIQDIILNKAQLEREVYLEYLQEEGLLSDEKIVLVDIGYSGTMQRKLKSITHKSFIGLYMLTHNYVLPNFCSEVFDGWLEEYDSQRSSIRHIFNNFIPLLESMLSSDQGSFVNFYKDKNGDRKINYLYSIDEDRRCYFVRSIQKGVIDFAQDFVNRLGHFSLDVELSPAISSELMFAFGRNPAPKDVKLFEGLLLENMFAGSEFNVIANAQKFLNKNSKLSKDNYNYLVNLSKWKEGAIVAYQKYLESPVVQTKALSQDCTVNTKDLINTLSREVEKFEPKEKSLTRKERLLRKLDNNPKLFIEDVKLVPETVKKVIVSNEVILKYTQLLIKRRLQ